MWVAVSVVRDIIFGAVRFGADLEVLLQKLDINLEDLDKTEEIFDFEKGHEVWQEALALTKDPYLGLHIGEMTTTSIVGLVGYLMQSSPNLLTAFAHLEKFSKTVTEMFFYHCKVIDKQCTITFEPIDFWQQNYPETARQAVEQAMAGSLNVCKMLVHKPITPITANFTYTRPKNTSEYQRVLGCELNFSQKENSLVFRLADFKKNIIGYNQELMQLFEQHLQENLQKLSLQESFTSKVKKIILQNFDNQVYNLDEVATILNLTNRSLQRKLKEEDTHFQAIVDEVRENFALNLIKYKMFTINEIAYKLGYNEPSAFRRAFKRWTGTNPKNYQI
jgi:AraC-like DNA-binding protein